MQFDRIEDENIPGASTSLDDEFDAQNDGPTFEDLAIDDTLSDLDRVTKYVRSNIALQRVIHVKMLQETSQSIGFQATLDYIIPLLDPLVNDVEYVVRQHVAFQFPGICRFLLKESQECQKTLSSGYRILLDVFIPLISKLMSDPQYEVRSAAGDSLVEMAAMIQQEDQGQHILTIVLPLAHDDDNEHYRTSAALLYNNLAQHLGPDLCQQFCVPELISLSEDPIFRVRKSTAQSFSNVARTVGYEITKERLFPAFLRLCHDDIWGVRKTCAECLVDISESLLPSIRAALLEPLLDDFLKDTSRWVRFAAYQNLGPLLATFEKDDIDDTLLTQFTNMALNPSFLVGPSDEMDIRYHCAYSFPAIVSIFGTAEWPKLAPAFTVLSQETFWRTRKTLAYSLHEMARLLGQEITETTLLGTFDEYVRDPRQDVRLGVLLHFADFIQYVSPSIRENYLSNLYEYDSFHHITKWRFRQVISDQLASLCGSFTPAATYSILYPLLLKLITDEVAIVRQASYHACPLLISQLQKHDENMTKEMLARLCTFASATNYRERQIYLHVCEAFLQSQEDGSIQWFKTVLAGEFFRLLHDPVSNVRFLNVKIILEHAEVMVGCATCPVFVKNGILDGKWITPEILLENIIADDRNDITEEPAPPGTDVFALNQTAQEISSASLESLQETTPSFHSTKLEHESTHDAVVEPVA